MESPHPSPLARSRASTLQNGTRPEAATSGTLKAPTVEESNVQKDDIFDKDSAIALDGSSEPPAIKESLQDVPAGFDDLPIELVSLTDR